MSQYQKQKHLPNSQRIPWGDHTMKYGELLKKLIIFTNTKIMVIANETGYDISYISKWCNKGILPTTRTISVINKKLSKVFANEIMTQDRLDDFFISFSDVIENTETNEDDTFAFLATSIESALSSCYRQSCAQESTSSHLQKSSIENNLFCHTQVLENMIRSIRQVLMKAEKEVTIIWTIDICKSFQYLNALEMVSKSPQNRIRCLAALDLEEFERNPEYYMKQLYLLLSKNKTVFFEFYNGKNMKQTNAIVVEDAFADMLSIDEHGNLDFSVNITNPADVKTLFSFFCQKMTSQELLLRSCTSKEINRSYRTEFYSGSKFHFFNTYGFEFLLPPETIDHIVDTAKSSTKLDITESMIRTLQITWEEIFENQEISFFFLLSSLYEYITTGEIYYTDIHYQLQVEERIAHIKNIIEVSKKNPNIKFIILDENIFASDFMPHISIYANDKKIFMKNYSAYETGIGPHLYIIHDKELIRIINASTALSLKNPTLYSEYNSEALEQLLEKYKSLIYRMMHMA